MAQSQPSQFMSDIEKAKIVAFNKDPIMKEAVRKVLLQGIYENGTLRAGIAADPTKNFALALAFSPTISNEDLGADLRAAANGISFVEQGFQRLANIKDDSNPPPEEENRGL